MCGWMCAGRRCVELHGWRTSDTGKLDLSVSTFLSSSKGVVDTVAAYVSHAVQEWVGGLISIVLDGRDQQVSL